MLGTMERWATVLLICNVCCSFPLISTTKILHNRIYVRQGPESLWNQAFGLDGRQDVFLGAKTDDKGFLDEIIEGLEDVDTAPVLFGAPPDLLDVTPSQELPLIQLALAGSVASFVGDAVMHPVDCVKTVMQSNAGIGMSVPQAVQFLFEQNGVAAFTNGLFTYATTDAMGGALKFSVWELWKRRTGDSIPNLWIGAALAFVASSVVSVPGEYIKQQLQMNYYDGLLSAIQGTWESLGVQGFYTGYEAVFYRDVPYTMLELGLYEIFKRMLDERRPADQEPSSWDEILSAAVTGGVVAFVTTPLDTVKTKLMVDDFPDASFLDCMLSTVHDYGAGALFSGLVARVGWILPFTVIYLPTYDRLKRLLWERHVRVISPESRNE